MININSAMQFLVRNNVFSTYQFSCLGPRRISRSTSAVSRTPVGGMVSGEGDVTLDGLKALRWALGIPHGPTVTMSKWRGHIEMNKA